MAKLIYSAITSLDGYVAVEEGNFDWAVPDEEVPLRRVSERLARDTQPSGHHGDVRQCHQRDVPQLVRGKDWQPCTAKTQTTTPRRSTSS